MTGKSNAGTRESITPRATYRLQLDSHLTLQDAARLADYLASLGISHLYPSPYLQTVPNSPNPYAIVDVHAVNTELGGTEGLAAMGLALHKNGLGQLLDIVPNHMAVVGRSNRWWWDVLRYGPASAYAHYFDIDWQAPESRMRHRVLLPVLGDQIGRLIESGKIQIVRSDGEFVVEYAANVFPTALASLAPLLREAATIANSDTLAFLADVMSDDLLFTTDSSLHANSQKERNRRVLLAQLNHLCREDSRVAAAIDQTLGKWNADPDLLDAFLRAQHYRLAWWRAGIHELNYRRFFNIDSLVGMCVENEDVFQDIHSEILRWLHEDLADAVRVDHIDGLRDPEQYLRRLRQEVPSKWILVEKVLMLPEQLPESWPVDGTTGYDFLNYAAGLFIDPAGQEPLSATYDQFVGQSKDYQTWLLETKSQVLSEMFGGELNRLTEIFVQICDRQRRYRDFTRHELHEVLHRVIVSFGVYRPYARPETGDVSEQDVTVTTQAVERAKTRLHEVDARLFDFLRDILLLRVRGELEDSLVLRFQQLTGPVMAKGLEDTAFYCYNRLISLNEVGGNPDWFGCSLEEFHQRCMYMQEHWPKSLLATATHDTKRGEDARLRIGLLSETPQAWASAVQTWSNMNQRYRRDGLPEPNAEYLFYQTLVGAWPLDIDRAVAFMSKASREAKVRTSWIDPDPEYDRALRGFVEGTLSDDAFCTSMEQFVAPLVRPARLTSLAQTLLKLTTPGIPDIYQGCELWDHNLVDPDNRRPVDFDLRRRLLTRVQSITAEEAMNDMDSGLPKMFLIQRALQFRNRNPQLFDAPYSPLETEGPKAAHAVAFSRGDDMVVITPRLVMGLADDWGDTGIELPDGAWRNVLTNESFSGGTVLMSDVLKQFPVALLAKGDFT